MILEVNHNSIGRIAQNEWVNCGITSLNCAPDGTVERWLQPKLFPAWLEQERSLITKTCSAAIRSSRSMARLKTALNTIFVRWFASIGSPPLIVTRRGVVYWNAWGNKRPIQAEVPFSWCFVIQCNPKPSSDSFLTEVTPFFDQTTSRCSSRPDLFGLREQRGRTVPRRRTCRQYRFGFSLQTFFADPRCHPTFCNGGARFRSSTLLTAHRDVLFRERGACIIRLYK